MAKKIVINTTEYWDILYRLLLIVYYSERGKSVAALLGNSFFALSVRFFYTADIIIFMTVENNKQSKIPKEKNTDNNNIIRTKAGHKIYYIMHGAGILF